MSVCLCVCVHRCRGKQMVGGPGVPNKSLRFVFPGWQIFPFIVFREVRDLGNWQTRQLQRKNVNVVPLARSTKDHSFNVLMVEAKGGDDFGKTTMKFLNQTHTKRGVVIPVCTWHYGEKTSSTFSSFDELRYAQDYRLDLLPLRMEDVWPPQPPCGTEHEFDKDGDALDLIKMAMRPAIAYIDAWMFCRLYMP